MHCAAGVASELPWPAIAGLVVLLSISAFFSASEVTFSSLHAVRLRGMAEESGFTGPLIAQMMQYRTRVLYTILLGNMIANVLIGVLLPVTLNRFFHELGVESEHCASCTVLLVSRVAHGDVEAIAPGRGF